MFEFTDCVYNNLLLGGGGYVLMEGACVNGGFSHPLLEQEGLVSMGALVTPC